jgi:hypothetical protein
MVIVEPSMLEDYCFQVSRFRKTAVSCRGAFFYRKIVSKAFRSRLDMPVLKSRERKRGEERYGVIQQRCLFC